ncbi:MAG: DUF4136 domain-containing protein [Moraxellaceae bacterium]
MKILLPLLALLLAGCGPRLMVEQAPGAGLPGPATYAWSQARDRIAGEDHPRVANDITAELLRQAIDQGLATRGWRPQENAAWHVHYHAGIEKRTEQVTEPARPRLPRLVCAAPGHHCYETWDWGYWGPPEMNTRTITYHEGTLVIDIHDAGSGKLVWRGTLSNEIDLRSAIDPVRLQKAVDKLLLQLPAARP